MEQIDKMVTDAMKAIASKGRGQVLGLIKDGDNKITIELKESLKPTDETENPSLYRSHQIDDLASFVCYAKKYGHSDVSVIMVSKSSAVLIIDEKADPPMSDKPNVSQYRGMREKIEYQFTTSDDWKAWKSVLNTPCDHRSLLRFLAKYEHNLGAKAVELLATLRTMKVTNTVNIDSDIQDNAETIGVVMKTNAGDQMKQFRKVIPIELPVFDQDVLDDSVWVSMDIKLDVDLPTESNKGPIFSLTCSKINQVYAKRVSDESQAIREAMGDEWLIVMGMHGETSRSYLRGQIVQDTPPHMSKPDRDGRSGRD